MRPKVGVSACLLGERVRYDGGHKRQDDLLATVGDQVEWVAVCPETELGLGAPRETIRLERSAGALRLVSTESRRDLTAAMTDWSDRRLAELEDLSGFVLKARSPSCGAGSTPVAGRAETTDGCFAAKLRAQRPELPIAEETDLPDRAAVERFLWRVGYSEELRRLFAGDGSLSALVRFHSEVKLLLMAYSPEAYRLLGRRVAQAARLPRDETAREYRAGFLAAIAEEPPPGRHANALQHAAGYFSQRLEPAKRRELSWSIARYGATGRGLEDCKRAVRELADRFGEQYLLRQRYLLSGPSGE